MESEEINSMPVENIELEEEPENEEEGNENNFNLLVKEENVEKDEPLQQINLVQNNQNENENENEGKEEEIEVEEEFEEEVEEENEGENQDQNEIDEDLKIKLNYEGADDPQEQENIVQERKIKVEDDDEKEESPMEIQDFKKNQNENGEISRGSEENLENDELSNRSDEDKRQILEIRMGNSEGKKSTQKFNLNDTEISATCTEDQNNMNIVFKKSTSSPNLILHWGLYDNYPINEWRHPNKESYPKNTKEFDAFALQTGFVDDGKESTIELELPKNEAKGISFVFYNPNINEWYNNNLKDFQIRFSS